MKTIRMYYFIVLSITTVVLTVQAVFPKEVIRFGFSMSLTGIYSQAAVSQMNAYQLWKEEVNARGGIFVKSFGKKLPIDFVYYDDRSSAEVAVKAYERLITNDKVDLLLTPWGTTIHFAVMPLAEKYKIPMIGSTAASVKLREVKSSYFWFITSCLPDRQMKSLVSLLSSLQIKNVAVIYVQDLFPKENLYFLEPELRRARINIQLLKDYPVGVKDLTTLLSEVKVKKPEALIALSYPADSFLLTRQAQEVGLDPPFFYQLVGPSIGAYTQVFGEACEGITTMGQWSPKAPWPGAKEFEERYRQRWKIVPDYLDSVLAYVQCQIIEQAIEKAGTLDRDKIRDTIAQGQFITINGPIKFTGGENWLTPSMVLQYQKGMLEIIWPQESATAKPIFPKPPWPTYRAQ
jgi:branched-chain amino acid transport system substrate-binding protein